MEIIKLRGVLVEILRIFSPKYKPYLTRNKKGVKQFLVHFQNAFYGTMVASILYCCKFTKILTETGFDIKPYDLHVTNKVIAMSQIKI